MKHRIVNKNLFAEAALDAVLILIAAALLRCEARSASVARCHGL